MKLMLGKLILHLVFPQIDSILGMFSYSKKLILWLNFLS